MKAYWLEYLWSLLLDELVRHAMRVESADPRLNISVFSFEVGPQNSRHLVVRIGLCWDRHSHTSATNRKVIFLRELKRILRLI